MDKVGGLRARLFAAKDGVAAHRALEGLARLAPEDARALTVLAEYARDGAIGHVRTHAMSRLAEIVRVGDAGWTATFAASLGDPALRYWATHGLLKATGASAYPAVLALALDPGLPLEERANAAKRLALHSGQPFDAGRPSDPGFWKQADLPLEELRAWAEQGFPSGAGHPTPPRHPALDRPATPLERAAARLERKLAKQRREYQDPAHPTDWLTPADPVDLERVAARWPLPAVYLDFLARFSPLRASLGSLRLYGAFELLEGQHGYSYDPVSGEAIEDWPASYVVIADDGGDPYALDLSRSDGLDAPVVTAEHGRGRWDFQLAAPSFVAFLETL